MSPKIWPVDDKKQTKDLPKNISWLYFCEKTTIGGLKYIFRRQPLSSHHRLVWIIIVLTMFTLTVWLCTRSTLRYLEYGINTRMYYENVDRIPFPAITFCNSNIFKRSVTGSSDALMQLLAFETSSESDLVKIFKQIEKDKKFCKSNLTTKFSSMSIEDALTKVGVLNTLIQVAEGYESYVIKCLWDNMETKCDNLFANHFTDIGWCFSFNPDKTLLYEGRIKNGTSPDDFSAKFSSKPGPKSGAKLLLNVDQKEYCGKSSNYDGAGYKLIIHDPLLKEPMYLSSPDIAPILLRPGVEMTITLRAVLFNRKTEHLGLCHSPQYPYFNGTKVYYKSVCFMLCHSMITFQQCGCFPNWLEGSEVFFAKTFDLPVEMIKICSTMEDFLCMHEAESTDIVESLPFLCPFCTKDPCVEMRFEHAISSSYFPSVALGNSLAVDFGMSLTEVRKNFALVNVFFENMNVLNVVESQSVEFSDLLIYYGGIAILFMGMSFMSFYEVVHQIIAEFHAVIWMLYQSRLQRKRRRNIKLHAKKAYHGMRKSNATLTSFIM